MLNSNSRNIYVALFFAMILSACGTGKVGGSPDCPKKSVEELEMKLKEKLKNDFDFLYTKVKIDVKDSKQSNSFKASVKMKPDSAFSGSVKVAGIMGAAYLIDQDSVGFKNRLKKCYKVESYSLLKEMFGSDVTYEFMQQLILGQPIAVNSLEQLYPVKHDTFYVLASHDKKAFQRLENMELETNEMEDVFVKYMLHCNTLKLARILIESPINGTKIKINFNERQDVEGMDFPKNTDVRIDTPLDSIFINLDYNKPEFDDQKIIRLSIPDSYEKCN